MTNEVKQKAQAGMYLKNTVITFLVCNGESEHIKIIDSGVLRTSRDVFQYADDHALKYPKNALFINGHCMQMGKFPAEVIRHCERVMKQEVAPDHTEGSGDNERYLVSRFIEQPRGTYLNGMYSAHKTPYLDRTTGEIVFRD